jgi:branched-chain amino acid transport system substrate-binding protein
MAKTGTFSQYDVPALNFFKLKMADINAAGGIDGRKLELIQSDTRSEPAQAKVAAQEVLSKGADVVLAVCDFDFGAPAGIAAEQAGKVSISPCTQSPKWGVQGIGPLSYTQSIATYSEGSVMAGFGKQKGFTKPFVLVDDTISYDREVCDGFDQTWKDPAAGEVTFKNSDSSIASQITKLKQSNPGFVVLCSYPPGGATALRQLRAAGIDVPVVMPGSMDGTYWTKSVPSLGELYVTASASVLGDDPNPKVNAVVKQYNDTYGDAPATGATLSGYSTAEMLEKALTMTKGDADGKTLAAALNTFKRVPLLAGETTFTPELHISTDREMEVLQYKKGAPVYLTKVRSNPDVKLSLSK